MNPVIKVLAAFLVFAIVAGIMPNGIFASFPIIASAVDDSYEVGDTIKLGSYPQTLVTDSKLINCLDNIDSEWLSYEYYSGTGSNDGKMMPSDYMRYKDVLYYGQRYRAVTFDTFRPFNTYSPTTTDEDSSYQAENGYNCNQIYWFKYDPIIWRVLDPQTGLVLSEKILDSQPFNNYCLLFNNNYYGDSNKSYFSTDYYCSSIRDWLNSDFYNTAFSAGMNCIQSTSLTNEAYTDSIYDSRDSSDKVFLLSYWDAKNTAYGFRNNSTGQTDYSKSAKGTDYAKIQGINASGDDTWDGYSWWRLRSAEDSYKTGKVGHDGGVGGRKITLTSGGIRPAMTLDLSELGNHLAEEAESELYLSQMPRLAEDDAVFFLSFLYNKDFSNEDLNNDIYYKLLTGRLEESMTAEEVRGLIMAFSLILQKTLNKQILTASDQNNMFCDLLISNLEKELAGRDPATEIVSEISGPIIGSLTSYLKDGLTDLGASVISQVAGIVFTDDDFDEAENILKGIKSFQSIPNKIDKFYNRVAMGVNGACFIYAQEKVGRYSFFSAYLNNRKTLEGDALSFANDYAFYAATENTYFSKLIDLFTGLTGKDSWSNHRDDIERWAEYCYQIGEYAKTSEHNYRTEVVGPSCMFSGYTHRWCTTCDYDEAYDFIDPLGHNYITQTQIQATCTQKGCKVEVCSRCGDIKRTYSDAIGHRAVDRCVVVPSCTQSGYTLFRCKCGYSWVENETPALGHSFVYSTTEPTENTQGYVQGICSICHDVIYKDFMPATGHQFIEQVTAPTCNSDGYTEYMCSECGYSYRGNITPRLSHQFVLLSSEPATCIKEGKNTFVCKLCGEEKNETTEMSSHNYSYSVTIKNATCVTDGFIQSECSCGETRTETLPSAGHSWELEESKDALCTSNGFKTFKCTVCGEQYTETTSMPYETHDYVCVEERQGQCTTIGYKLYQCSHCRHSYYEQTSVFTDHSFGEWVVTLSNEEYGIYQYSRTCNVCGQVETEARNVNGVIRVAAEDDWIVPGAQTRISVLNNDEIIEDLHAVGLSLRSSPGTVDAHGCFIAGPEDGTATIECMCGDVVVASTTVHVVIPESIRFLAAYDQIYYSRRYPLVIQGEYQNRLFRMNAQSLQITLSDENAGHLDGLEYTACLMQSGLSSVTINAAVLNHPEISAEYTVIISEAPPITIEEGTYVFHNALDPSKVLDIEDNSTEKRANIQLHDVMYNQPQKFRIVNKGDYYCIQSVYNGLWLDIHSPYDELGSNIQLYNRNTSTEEKWVFENAGNGNVYIRSLYGYYVGTNEHVANNANIVTCEFDGSSSQQWKLVRVSELPALSVEEGVYELHNIQEPSKVMGFKGVSMEGNETVELDYDADSVVQKFRVVHLGTIQSPQDQNVPYYGIQSLLSDKWVEINNPVMGNKGLAIQMNMVNTNPEEKWIFEDAGNGNVLIRSFFDVYLDTLTGHTESEIPLQTNNYDADTSQQWEMVKTSPYPCAEVADGVYTIHSAANPQRVMDIQDNSMENRANIQLNDDLNNAVQRFIFTKHLDAITNLEYYSIQSVYSALWLDTKRATAGSTIQLFNDNTRKDEKWIIEDVGNGNVVIRSLYDTYIDTEDGKSDIGTKVQTSVFSMSSSMEWTLHRVYTVTYDANGGTDTPSAQGKQDNIDLTLYKEQPKKAGYTFVGWNTESDGSGTSYAGGSVYTLNNDLFLYAQWEKNPVLGDADGDGSIDLKDVVQITRFLVGGWNVTMDMTVADVNQDGQVNLKDVVILRRYLAGGWGISLGQP